MAEGEESVVDVNSYLIAPNDVELVDLIGQGSTAVVYRGQLRGEQEIAVKEISGTKEESLTAFQRELGILIKVKHPHIVAFFGLIAESYPLRICLEFCRGGSLFDLLHNQIETKLSWRQRLVILYDTATAVEHLHSYRPAIVHRDLKSLNVLLLEPVSCVDDPPHIKLVDFGFAKETEVYMTQFAGTVHWMAPEVVNGTTYTEMADAFSFAMIAYEVVCRCIPFIREKPKNVPRLICGGARPSWDLQDQEVPSGLLELIERCWDQEPMKRPTFTDIWQDLTKVSANCSKELKLFAPEPSP